MDKIQSSEYCTVGHPDRTCDYIASYILDRYLSVDPKSRVALEVQLKNEHCTISGEVTSRADFDGYDISDFAREAVEKIGYTMDYQSRFGAANVVCGSELETVMHITRQSADIAGGVDRDAWGDQGIFWGYAVDDPQTGFMPRDHYLARKLGQELAGRCGGLDVKTLVTLEDGEPAECVIAIPLSPADDEHAVRVVAESLLGPKCPVVVNGTGRYVTHGSVGDCGTTGRKLVVDFYGGNSRIGGGSPWGKDPTKADVTLNILARRYALEGMRRYGFPEMRSAITCCIGRRGIRVCLFDREMNLVGERFEDERPSAVIERLGLNKPVYGEMCRNGLFGHEAD